MKVTTRYNLELASENACNKVGDAIREYLQIQRALGRTMDSVLDELRVGDMEQCGEVWDED